MQILGNNDLVIIGVGNTLRRDDGIGIVVIEELRKSAITASLIDGGTDALNLIETIKQYKSAIIIDAVRMGSTPGTVKTFSPNQVNLIKNDSLSTHGLGLAEMLTLAKQLAIPTNITIIGIEPNDITYGDDLSKTVKQQIPTIMNMIKHYVNA